MVISTEGYNTSILSLPLYGYQNIFAAVKTVSSQSWQFMTEERQQKSVCIGFNVCFDVVEVSVFRNVVISMEGKQVLTLMTLIKKDGALRR